MSQTVEMEGAPWQQRSGTVKRKRWGGLRQQWKLLGLFEIDEQHEFYGLTCMMKAGLQGAVQSSMDRPPPDVLSEQDFRMEVTQVHEGFSMETFAGPVFCSLRSSLGLSEVEYQTSLCSTGSFLQFISNSKSKAHFFLTNDKRFFLKTQNKREVKFLLANLRIYKEHLEKYPHTLLVKFLGVHRIKIPHKPKRYFIVMQSVFYPDDRINTRYDIKGCEVSRWTEPAPAGSQIIVVLKDLNFEGQFITLDQQRSWLVRQVEVDTQFLQRLNVLDYSLLLAQQPLHHDERQQGLSFATLIMRTKRSVNPGSSPIHAGTVPGSVPEEDAGPSEAGGLPGGPGAGDHIVASQPGAGDHMVASQPGAGDHMDAACPQHSSRTASQSAELQDFRAQNRRLLPNFKNPLHVIDGPEQRYFVGIIDIFTVYSFRKRLEHLWKRLRHPGQTFSTVSPPAYCLRLCSWVQDHTK